MDEENYKLIRAAFQFFTDEQVTFITEPASIVFGPLNEKRILTKDSFPGF